MKKNVKKIAKKNYNKVILWIVIDIYLKKLNNQQSIIKSNLKIKIQIYFLYMIEYILLLAINKLN